MGKKKRKIDFAKKSIKELKDSRTGGQNALRGYSYQFLYSCYLLLSAIDLEDSFQMEGVEDIDYIKHKKDGNIAVHIQLKYSVNCQNACFMKAVLKNFLEAYLIDNHRSFKLVYDFQVSNGYLKKLFESDMDDKSILYWKGVISEIQKDNPSWNWTVFKYEEFMDQLSFEKVEKRKLEEEIEKALIEHYEITTDNISLFANGIKIKCFEEMEHRGFISKKDVDLVIQNVKIDISKGDYNPAHSWIRKVYFEVQSSKKDLGYFEGKKATPSDIASQYPIRRFELERSIEKSISENTVTVIKASSGQGKTTVALQCMCNLKSEYKPYQLLCCNDKKEIGNIVQFFKARVRLGEKVLILIDNLDSHVKEWGVLVQTLHSELHNHYRVLITTRETDWYNYCGDLSEIRSINIIKPSLEAKEAKEIYDLLKKTDRLHSSIDNWRSEWNKISERKLLIEYVYLLTHGTMLSERISAQISEIGKSTDGKVKCDILRKVSLADISGIRLSIQKLCQSLEAECQQDYGELLKSLEEEFLIHVDNNSHYIEGLHPVRSKHVFSRLHEYTSIEKTAYSLVGITDKEYIPALFSYYAVLKLNRDDFCERVANLLVEEKEYATCLMAIKGSFSGSVLQYYRDNERDFIDANNHGGLLLISTEKCPFAAFKEFDLKVSSLDALCETMPTSNIQYLCNLRDKMAVCELKDTFVYHLCKAVFGILQKKNVSEIDDFESYAYIVEWLNNIDEDFSVSKIIDLDEIWKESNRLSLDAIASLMYTSYCGNREYYIEFTKSNLESILLYLKHNTKSHAIYIEEEKNAIHVEYILHSYQLLSANSLSVDRLKNVCKMLPIFEYYCADAMRPKLDILKNYEIPDDAHKEIPIGNLVITFHQEMISLWLKTIRSNFEVETIGQWLDYWFSVRKQVCDLLNTWNNCIIRVLSGKSLGSMGKKTDSIFASFSNNIIGEVLFPKEDRPFEKKNEAVQGFSEIKGEYFSSLQNVGNQFGGFLLRKENEQRLAIVNLTIANSYIDKVHDFFGELAVKHDYLEKHLELCDIEKKALNKALMSFEYYKAHYPDQYFNKYQIEGYYIKEKREELKRIEEAFSYAKENYDIESPMKMYNEGQLKYYPMIIKMNQPIDEDMILSILIGSSSLAYAPFDYLVILFMNDENKIKGKAVQISRKTIEYVKYLIDTGDDLIESNVLPPYPVNVTNKMLDCFGISNSFDKDVAWDTKVILVEDVFEELWFYSKIKELAKEFSDSEYYQEESKESKERVDSMMQSVKIQCDKAEFDWIMDTCNKVYSGEKFDDNNYNRSMEKIMKSC